VSPEHHETFPCFGGTVELHVGGTAADGTAASAAVRRARERLEEIHRRLSRFRDESELSLLNRDPRQTVPASPLLRMLARSAVDAGRRSGGLVDCTLLGELALAGYRDSLRGREPLPLEAVLAGRRDARVAGAPASRRGWELIEVDDRQRTITRPPGLGIDGGGIAKGLAADLIATRLGSHRTFAVDCCGDLRIGGDAGAPRTVHVSDPFGGEPLHSLALARGAVATSGIGARSWAAPGGGAHHLLDPATGRPAFTGVVQATALAPTGFLAEVYAKSALLAGPQRAAERLPHGGVIVGEDGRAVVVAASAGATATPVSTPGGAP
jgi:thiamine biosynthesis lipoprotein